MQRHMRESWEKAAAVVGFPSLETGTYLHLEQIKAELHVSVLGL